MQAQNHVAGLKEGADVDTPASTSQLVAPAQKQIRCVFRTKFIALHHMHHTADISDPWTHPKLLETCVWRLVTCGS